MIGFKNIESAEGDLPAQDWAMAVVKVACILIIGIVILNGIVFAANVSAGSVFYTMYTGVISSINSGYTLAGLIVLVLGAGAVMHFLGFM